MTDAEHIRGALERTITAAKSMLELTDEELLDFRVLDLAAESLGALGIYFARRAGQQEGKSNDE